MTKYILHGGFAPEKAPLQEDDAFFEEILKDTSQDVKILLVYFAEREEMVELRIKQDKEALGKQKGSKNLEFRVASRESFLEDCKWADVIYLHGGKTSRILETLSTYQNLGEIFKGKTIAGDSAGANVLACVFYSKNSKEIGQGLGILPLKISVHYVDGMQTPLLDVELTLETLLLHEYETIVKYY